MPRAKKKINPEDLKSLTREQEEAIWDIIQQGTKIAKKYFQYGEEMGEAVRGRFVEAVVTNAKVRGHITRPNEMHTILHRCWVDEIRSKLGTTQKPKKYPKQEGATQELRDDVLFNPRHANDGGIGDAISSVYLEQEADALLREKRPRKARGRKTVAPALVAATLAQAEGRDTLTEQDMADAAGVSKASVSRALKTLAARHREQGL